MKEIVDPGADGLSLATSQPRVIRVKAVELDIAYCEEFERTLAQAQDYPHVIIDLSEARYIDSTCITRLVRMRKARRDRGLPREALVICAPSIRRILGVAGLNEMWVLCDSLEEAKREAL